MKYKAIFSNSKGSVRLIETLRSGFTSEHRFETFGQLKEYCRVKQIDIHLDDFATED